MSVDANKAVVRQVIHDLYSGQFTIFDQHPGLAEVKDNLMALHSAMPDIQQEITLEFGEGDWVVHRLMLSGTQTGSLFGMPPTGRRATWQILMFNQVQDGRIVRQHSQADGVSFLQQLGYMPSDGGQ